MPTTSQDVLNGQAKWAVDTGNVIPYLESLPADSVQTCVTSPPYYGLRAYLEDDHPAKKDEIGAEKTPQEYLTKMVGVFREVRRVLHPTGTLFLNIGDSYLSTAGRMRPLREKGKSFKDLNGPDADGLAVNASSDLASTWGMGIKPKDMLGVPWRLALALQDDGWYLRADIIWSKGNAMPESVQDRPPRTHEYVFLLTKSPSYFYDQQAVLVDCASAGVVPGGTKLTTQAAKDTILRGGGVTPATFYAQVRDKRPVRTVWDIPVGNYKGAHFATMPLALAERCVRLGTPDKGVCPTCGTPWHRVLEKVRVPTRPGVQSKTYVEPPVHPLSPVRTHNGDVCGNRDPKRHVTSVKTVGWEAGCGCGKAPVPAVVLDPFVGSGTTLLVATRLVRLGAGRGRRAIGCELNPKYAEVARKRIQVASRGLVS